MTPSTDTSAGPHAIRVLIVDDDRDWCEATSMALESAGMEPVAVHSGDEALERVEVDTFDVAVIDVHMPGRWGVDVVKEIRRQHGERLPILIATAAPTASGVCEGLLAGADEEFFKFESQNAMVLKLRRLWEKRLH